MKKYTYEELEKIAFNNRDLVAKATIQLALNVKNNVFDFKFFSYEENSFMPSTVMSVYLDIHALNEKTLTRKELADYIQDCQYVNKIYSQLYEKIHYQYFIK